MSAYINMSTLLYYAYAVSHCTSNFVNVFYDTSIHHYHQTLTLVVICGLFVLGGTASAFINRAREFSIEHPYGQTQIATGVVIGICFFTIRDRDMIFIAAMSFIMGMQNALIYSYRGAIFKPSHITTTFSNLGQYIGDFIMGMPESKRLVRFELSLVVSFALGTVVSLLSFSFFRGHAFILASGGYIILGFIFIGVRRSLNRVK